MEKIFHHRYQSLNVNYYTLHSKANSFPSMFRSMTRTASCFHYRTRYLFLGKKSIVYGRKDSTNHLSLHTFQEKQNKENYQIEMTTKRTLPGSIWWIININHNFFLNNVTFMKKKKTCDVIKISSSLGVKFISWIIN